MRTYLCKIRLYTDKWRTKILHESPKPRNLSQHSFHTEVSIGVWVAVNNANLRWQAIRLIWSLSKRSPCGRESEGKAELSRVLARSSIHVCMSEDPFAIKTTTFRRQQWVGTGYSMVLLASIILHGSCYRVLGLWRRHRQATASDTILSKTTWFMTWPLSRLMLCTGIRSRWGIAQDFQMIPVIFLVIG